MRGSGIIVGSFIIAFAILVGSFLISSNLREVAQATSMLGAQSQAISDISRQLNKLNEELAKSEEEKQVLTMSDLKPLLGIPYDDLSSFIEQNDIPYIEIPVSKGDTSGVQKVFLMEDVIEWLLENRVDK